MGVIVAWHVITVIVTVLAIVVVIVVVVVSVVVLVVAFEVEVELLTHVERTKFEIRRKLRREQVQRVAGQKHLPSAVWGECGRQG